MPKFECLRKPEIEEPNAKIRMSKEIRNLKSKTGVPSAKSKGRSLTFAFSLFEFSLDLRVLSFLVYSRLGAPGGLRPSLAVFFEEALETGFVEGLDDEVDGAQANAFRELAPLIDGADHDDFRLGV